jgi:putative ABC transport system permease protein
MIKNYLKIAWRNLIKNKASSLINIGGLAVGMAVAMLIGLWIWDELSVDTSFKNRDRIAIVMENAQVNSETQSFDGSALPLAPALRASYGRFFKQVIISSHGGDHLLTYNNKTITKKGYYMEPAVTDMLSLKILKGSAGSLNDPTSVLLSQSTATAVFGDADPLNKNIKIDKEIDAKVTGIYQDLPQNSSFGDLTFLAPWQMLAINQHYASRFSNPWGANWFQTFVQVADDADMDQVSAKIKNIKLDALNSTHNSDARFKSALFLHPMSRWYLYGKFKNGLNTGGRIQYVWLFGLIGVFVLLLACINFMNLSTARSEKRAKEVGIRKAIGSVRSQLIAQFYSESLLMAFLAFAFSLLLVLLCLPAFNQLAGKNIGILWSSPLFWSLGIAFTLFTGLIAGSYPALYLSSFRPVKVLKGAFKVGRLAAVPRKVLVVVQFTVSIVLIIGTIVVFQQIQFAKNRPVGYSRANLVNITLPTNDINKQYQSLKNDLLASGAVSNVAESESQVTQVYNTNGGFTWNGKDPALQEQFTTMAVTSEFGKTVDWKVVTGRDFDPSFKSDSTGFIINEAAVKFMGLKHPIGETVTWSENPHKIIGVVKNMVVQSAYADPQPNIFYLPKKWNSMSNVDIKINPLTSAHEAITKITAIFKKYDPATTLNYQFVDESFAQKFDNEERVGKLASCFAGLAILISCLGLFGMATFMAEQRIKEIGVRKVLGATVFSLWQLLSKDFVILVVISLLIAAPAAYLFMHNWLQGYAYRTEIAWWVFAITAFGAMFITLATVSYQSIKAALTNPVKSLKTE